jgi:hypothetical protein
MQDTKLSRQFTEGLQQYGLEYSTVISTFRYAGGNMQDRHKNYFKLVYKNDKYPASKSHCLCGHKITENCYITDGDTILTLGNCCIKRFIPKACRTCHICGTGHRNRIVNRCMKCRYGMCDICNKKCDSRYTKCYVHGNI